MYYFPHYFIKFKIPFNYQLKNFVFKLYSYLDFPNSKTHSSLYYFDKNSNCCQMKMDINLLKTSY